MKKTFKREIAVALLLWLVYIVEVKDDTIIEILVWPIFAFVTAAFGLVAALAWNDTIRAIFNEVFGTPNHVGAMVIYAITVTIIAVIAIWAVNHFATQMNGK